MDCSSAHRGIRLGTNAAIYRSRSGRHLWRRCQTATAYDGHQTDRSQRNHLGKMDTRRGSSVRSDGTALITSWYLASDTFATCWDCTKDITMTFARTCRSTKIPQCHVQFRPLAASCPIPTSEVCTISTYGFDLRQGQAFTSPSGIPT